MTATLLQTQLEGGSNERRGGEDGIGLMGDDENKQKRKLADSVRTCASHKNKHY